VAPPAAAKPPVVAYSLPFRFADSRDRVFLFFGVITLIHGALPPLFPVILGDLMNAFDPSK